MVPTKSVDWTEIRDMGFLAVFLADPASVPAVLAAELDVA